MRSHYFAALMLFHTGVELSAILRKITQTYPFDGRDALEILFNGAGTTRATIRVEQGRSSDTDRGFTGIGVVLKSPRRARPCPTYRVGGEYEDPSSDGRLALQ